MTETTLKDMFGRILDAEAPPPRPVDEVITRNGRILRRRRFGGVLVAAVLAIAAGIGGGALLDTGGPPSPVAAPRDPVPRAGESSAAPPGPPAVSPVVLGKVKARLVLLARLLEAAVPAGYEIAKVAKIRGDNGVVYPVRTVEERRPADPARWNDEHNWTYVALLEVRDGGRAAVLTLESFPLDPALDVDPSDLCRTLLPRQQEDDCTVALADDGQPVRLSSLGAVKLGKISYSVRFYPGFAIRFTQRPRGRPGVPSLERQVLGQTALTNLPANPKLAPRPPGPGG